jgi:hypothetical protein
MSLLVFVGAFMSFLRPVGEAIARQAVVVKISGVKVGSLKAERRQAATASPRRSLCWREHGTWPAREEHRT